MYIEKNLFLARKQTIIFLLLFSIPFVSWYNSYIPFLYFLILIFLSFNYCKKISFFIVFKLFLNIIFLFYYINDLSTLKNILAIILTDFFALFLAYMYLKNDYEFLLRKLFQYSFYGLIVAFFFSLIFSGFSDILNPIESLSQGKRLLLLSPEGWGHSIINEWGILALIIFLSLDKFNSVSNFFKILILIVMLYLAGNGTALACIIILILAFIVEKNNLRNNIKNLIHILFLFFSIFIVLNQDIFSLIVQWIRFEILGQDINMYRNDDFTSGRADLTRLLINVANENPWFGGGQDHPVLKYGVTLETGDMKGATSESPLRLAAKYGWIYFIITMIIWIIPFFAGFKYSKLRKFFIFTGYAILILGGTNSGFSVPQSNFYIFYYPIVVLSVLVLFDNKYRIIK